MVAVVVVVVYDDDDDDDTVTVVKTTIRAAVRGEVGVFIVWLCFDLLFVM